MGVALAIETKGQAQHSETGLQNIILKIFEKNIL
jgi:hypothetical protein